jgi:DNA mismatch repair protein MutL
LTRTEDNPAAAYLHIKDGKVIEKKDASRAVGTTITIENLFGSVPARLKFLKQDATETRYIKQVLIRLILANPVLDVELIVDDNPSFHYTKVRNWQERVIQLYGDDFQNILLEARTEAEGFALTAYYSKPQYMKSNRNYQFLFINRRAVEVNFFHSLMKNLYEKLAVPGRYPIAFVYLTVSPEEVDVNVHPSKREVRFRNSGKVFDIIFTAMRQQLQSAEGVHNFKAISLSNPFKNGVSEGNMPREETGSEKPESYKEGIARSIAGFMDRHSSDTPILPGTGSYSFNSTRSEMMTPFTEKGSDGAMSSGARNTLLTGLFGGSVIILGQLFNTYILIESGNTLFLIDQHAAQERIIYERLKRDLQDSKVASQPLLLPFQISIDPARWDSIEQNFGLFEKLGYDVEDFGHNSLLIRSVPSFLRRSNDRDLVQDLVDLMTNEENRKIDAAELMEKALESIACKSAVKAGDLLGREEMEVLLEQLFGLDNILNCPHGRPFIIQFQKTELEKLFSRRN